ncbi:hypothetical protein AgCh_006046 [Apium graveolens]
MAWQDLHKEKLLGTGVEKGGLYYFSQAQASSSAQSSKKVSAVTCSSSIITCSKLWHLRLGHAPNTTLSHIPHINKLIDCNKDCPICPFLKQSMLSFSKHSDSYASSIFSFIHMDVWGPYHIASTQGCKYFLAIVDDHSRATWTFLLSSKQQVFQKFQAFVAYVDNHFHVKIQTIRIDNGSEFLNSNFSLFLTEKGILHQRSCTQTPQQNARVERKHKHLLEVARSLRFQSALPHKYWGEFLLTATYLVNLLPSPVLQHKSPYEVLYNTKRDYSLLKAFGCLCYASVHSSDKLAIRAIQCVFIGYPYLQKGYKLLRLDNYSIFVSRHVKFLEHIFPYHHKSSTSLPFVTTTSCTSYTFLDWLSSHHSDSFTSDILQPDLHLTTNPLEVSSHVTSSPPFSASSDHFDHFDMNVPHTKDSHISDSSIPRSTYLPSCSSEQSLRLSTRVKARPPWWNDYHVPNSSKPTVLFSQLMENHNFLSSPSALDPFSLHMSHHTYDSDNQEILAYCHKSDIISEPHHYYQAIKDPRWVQAIDNELQALEANNTWVLMSLPPGKPKVGCKWGFKVKYKPTGEIDRFKTRLVAKGYTQTAGLDYHETFAPVIKLVTVRSLLAIDVAKGWFIEQLDVNNTFLHGGLSEEVYMELPLDDILQSSNDFHLIQSLKTLLDQKFSTKDIGPAKYYLGLELHINKQGVFLVQHKFITDLIASVDMSDCKPLSIPINPHVKLYDSSISGPLLVDPSSYRALVGKLLYLTSSRPDIAYYVQLLSQFIHAPREAHMTAVKRAEYRALADTSCEVLWLRNLLSDLDDLGVHVNAVVPLFCDNKSAVDLTANPVYHARTKHIEIDCHFIREKIKDDLVYVSQISTKDNTSDILTKGLGKVPHWLCSSKLGLTFSICGEANKNKETSKAIVDQASSNVDETVQDRTAVN